MRKDAIPEKWHGRLETSQTVFIFNTCRTFWTRIKTIMLLGQQVELLMVSDFNLNWNSLHRKHIQSIPDVLQISNACEQRASMDRMSFGCDSKFDFESAATATISQRHRQRYLKFRFTIELVDATMGQTDPPRWWRRRLLTCERTFPSSVRESCMFI